MNNSNIAEEEVLLVADSGSTKTDWGVVAGGEQVKRFNTQGINPFHQSGEKITDVLKGELLPQLGIWADAVSAVRFYGAGCRADVAGALVEVLSDIFPKAKGNVKVASDLEAAAVAVCGSSEGLACILGTGSNSCLWNGQSVVENISPLGYILGDEGSGAVLGRLFINALFKGGLPQSLKQAFLEQSGQSVDDIIRRTYREPLANRYLASFAPFIHQHLDCAGVRKLVVDNFRDFFNKNVFLYNRPDLPVGAVGSMAYYFRCELEEAATLCGLHLGKIDKSPMDGMLANIDIINMNK